MPSIRGLISLQSSHDLPKSFARDADGGGGGFITEIRRSTGDGAWLLALTSAVAAALAAAVPYTPPPPGTACVEAGATAVAPKAEDTE